MATGVIKTVRRIFEVLEYFDIIRQPKCLRDIAAEFGYPTSSAAVLLKSLVTMGYLDYDRNSRTYMPTMRIATLGGWIQDSIFGDSRVPELMEHLGKVTGETISIGTQSDLYAQYLDVMTFSGDQEDARQSAARYHVRAGVIRPIARSGIGWLLLSARSDDTIDLLVRRVNAEMRDSGDRVCLGDLMERIRLIRARGYVFSKHTVTPGKGLIGMLLPIRSHGRRLAIGVAGSVERLEAKEELILREMRSMAAALHDATPLASRAA